LCRTPSELQFVVLYAGIALAAIGSAGTRFTVATMGANPFDKPEDQGIFFNWYFSTTYVGALISATAIVYIEDIV
jgi:peptide/histidine transporter 3/4